jgi:hypothetical protein
VLPHLTCRILCKLDIKFTVEYVLCKLNISCATRKQFIVYDRSIAHTFVDIIKIDILFGNNNSILKQNYLRINEKGTKSQ